MRETAKFCLDSLAGAGAEKSQAVYVKSQKHELNVEAGKISLLRTTFNTNIRLTAIKDSRRGTVNLNLTDKTSIEEASKTALEITQASAQDSAYDISEKQPQAEFDNNIEKPDLDMMYEKLVSFLSEAKRLYPYIMFENLIIDFSRRTEYLLNSNGVDFKSSGGIYNFVALFTAKDGKKTSSFNYSGVSLKNLDKKLLSCGSINTLLRQSSGQLDPKHINGKFTGDIIVTPDCLNDFLSFITDQSIGDGAIIAGTSVYKDKIDKEIASSKFTLHSKPVSDEIADGYHVTPDGFKAENQTIVDKGVLKTFLLGLYGSRKTGLKRSPNSGGCYIVDPGDTAFDDMVKSVERGILLARVSGGEPNNNGDFSAVAKNSYYIENGEIKYPISETMISGNIQKMLMDMKDISRERIDFGNVIFPWILFPGLTVSGK